MPPEPGRRDDEGQCSVAVFKMSEKFRREYGDLSVRAGFAWVSALFPSGFPAVFPKKVLDVFCSSLKAVATAAMPWRAKPRFSAVLVVASNFVPIPVTAN
jgi:hypothetical protein